MGLRPLASCDRGFESRSGHGCLCLVSVVCCQVEISGRSDHSPRGILPSVCVSESDRKASEKREGHDLKTGRSAIANVD